MQKEYVLDGTKITSLETFFDQVSESVIPGSFWGRNLNAFNDILRGGFGTPEDGFVIRWSHSEISRENLGYPETIERLEKILEQCHPSDREPFRTDLMRARAGEGPTIFDWLIDIIQIHGPGGREAEDNVQLVLE